MDIYSAILIYLTNGFGIWCLCYQMDKTLKGIGGMLACMFLWPFSVVLAIYLTIVEAW